MRFVIVMQGLDGVSARAVWQDLKVGVEHLRAWKRIALVTDIEWMRHLTSMIGWMTPGAFGLDQRDEAVTWAAG